MLLVSTLAWSAPGDFDTTFGNGGTATINITPATGQSPASSDSAYSIAIQPDGKVVIAGSTSTSSASGRHMAVARLLPNGLLDTTFGDGGTKQLTFGISESFAYTDQVAQNGDIVLGGSAERFPRDPQQPTPAPQAPTVVTLSPSGQLRPTGSGYFGFVQLPGNGEVTSSALQADGKLLVAGTTDLGSGSAGFVSRLQANFTSQPMFTNALDASFAPDAAVQRDLQLVHAVGVLPDGRIAIAGSGRNGYGVVMLLQSNGALDASFGGSGTIVFGGGPRTSGSGVRALAIGPDGRIVVGGNINFLFGNIPTVAQFNVDGSSLPSLLPPNNLLVGNPTFLTSVATAADSSVVATFDSANAGRYIVRFKADGSVDSGFGNDGVARLGAGTPRVAAMQRNRILVGGDVFVNASFAMYVTALQGEPSCNVLDQALDCDDDGIPNGLEAAEGKNPRVKDNDVIGSDRLFVMQTTRDLLAREATPAEIAAGIGSLSAGQSRSAFIEAMIRNIEYQDLGGPITRLYRAYFLREPDAGGLSFWIREYKRTNQTNFIDISNFFAISPEFVQRYGSTSNAQFVTLVYQNVLGRAPDPTGFAFWQSELDAGRRARGQVMADFSESPENKAVNRARVEVVAVYNGLLRKEADAAQLAIYTPIIQAGGSIQPLIASLMADAAYRARFLP